MGVKCWWAHGPGFARIAAVTFGPVVHRFPQQFHRELHLEPD
jgi:hypothetical protein